MQTKKKPEVQGRVMARLFAKDLREVLAGADEYKDCGTQPADADTTLSEAATAESGP